MRITDQRRAAGQRRTMLWSLVAGALIALATPAAARPLPMDQIDYGPDPGWTRFHATAEQAIRNRLIDPDSAKFDWPWGYHKGGMKPLLQGWVYGYYTCGSVNSRNRMGGYAGRQTFIIVMNYDRVLHVDFGNGAGSGLVDETCQKAVQQGLLPPVPNEDPPATATSPAPATDMSGAYDFATKMVADGAKVTDVKEVALQGGLRPSMIITSINGIALKGLPNEVVDQIIRAAAGPARIMILGDTAPLTIRRAPVSGGRP